MRVIILASLIVLGAWTGCIGSGDETVTPTETNTSTEDDPTPETPGEGNATEPELETVWKNGSVGGAGTDATGFVCSPTACDNSIAFDVEEGTRAIVLEAAWNASTEMLLRADAPDEETCEDVGPGGLLVSCEDPEAVTGASPLRIELTEEQWTNTTGEWFARVWPAQAPQAVEVTLVATVIYGGLEPAEVAHVSG